MPVSGGLPYGIAVAPDGLIWFTLLSGGDIGNFNLTTRTFHIIHVPHSTVTADLIAVSPNGTVWFTEILGNRIAELNPSSGDLSTYAIPTAGSSPSSIAGGGCGGLSPSAGGLVGGWVGGWVGGFGGFWGA